MLDCILTSPSDESVITYTQLSGVQGVDTESHILPTIQSQFSDINLSIVSQQATASQVIDDVMRQLSFDETELDGEAGFADVARGGVDSSGLSHDASLGVDDMDLNLNEPEPILSEVSTQEPIVAEVNNEGNGQEDESAPTDGQFFYDDEGIDIAYETKYDVQYSEDSEPDVDVHLFGISMDLSFDNIGITNLVSDDVLEGEDVDVINADGFDSDPGNDEEKNYRKRRLAELRTEMEGVINASGQWKYSFYTGKKFTTPKEAKDRVYLHSIESRRNLKLYKNDGVRIRARCDGKVAVFTMSQGTRPTRPNRGMEARPSGLSVPTTRSKKKEEYRINLDILVKAVQDQLQRELEDQISMSKAFRAKAKAEREIKGDHIAVERNADPSFPTRVFQIIYICLEALKLGFRACRIDMLGLDGAFMKGPFPGQVLVAVGLDSNNGIYPLAYALVEAESKSSWCWFLQCLGDDIDLHPNLNFTFISDRQKGIIPAIKTVYQSRAKSDLLINNICEVFNGKIVGGRDKPVITLLEYIKEYCMKRIVNVQGVIDKRTDPLTSTATRIMKSIKKEAQLMKL
ncbi:heat stress transcription factor B-4-like protein [Tanacetum coccineum]